MGGAGTGVSRGGRLIMLNDLVPKDTVLPSRHAARASVLDRGGPAPLSYGPRPLKSAGGPTQSKTLRQLGWFRGKLILAFFFAVLPLVCDAQNGVLWTTNYYAVTGTTLPELRQSIREKRPWKASFDWDGMTDWQVRWQFSVTPTPGGCRCNNFSTSTSITVTLPRWVAPTNAPETVKQIWQKYWTALAHHEAGHAAIALAAAAEIQKRVKEVGEGADCDFLKRKIKELAQGVVETHRKRDKDYDERTRHGATQGATLPGRPRRERERGR